MGLPSPPPGDVGTILLAGQHGFFEAEASISDQAPDRSVARHHALVPQLGDHRPQRHVGNHPPDNKVPLA
jgi:hypothetical protein